MKSSSPLCNGATVTGTIDALANTGKSIFRHDGMAIFADRGIPGQTVEATITKCSKRFAEAAVSRIVSPAPTQTAAPCSHFGTCGGCLWQEMPYDEQCRWKEQFVADALRRIGGLTAPAMQNMPEQHTDGKNSNGDSSLGIRPILAAPEQYYYRNKMEFAFTPVAPEATSDNAQQAGDSSVKALAALGLRRHNSHDIVEVTDCMLQSTLSMRIVRAVRGMVAERKLPAYNQATKRGFLRFLVIRESHHTDDTMVQIITAPDFSKNGAFNAAVRKMGERLCNGFGLTSFVHSERRHPAQIAYGERHIATLGNRSITDTLNGTSFMLGADSFFQTNTVMAEALYREAIKLADLTGDETVWDLYCGVGTIALSAAPHCRNVTGLELTEEAVNNAKANATANNITHAKFLAGDVKRLIRELPDTPDVVFTDPPRAGMDPAVVAELLMRAPKRIVYISCNPATQARDVGLLLEKYSISAIQPADLFPQTPHVENIITLELNS